MNVTGNAFFLGLLFELKWQETYISFGLFFNKGGKKDIFSPWPIFLSEGVWNMFSLILFYEWTQRFIFQNSEIIYLTIYSFTE